MLNCFLVNVLVKCEKVSLKIQLILSSFSNPFRYLRGIDTARHLRAYLDTLNKSKYLEVYLHLKLHLGKTNYAWSL